MERRLVPWTNDPALCCMSKSADESCSAESARSAFTRVRGEDKQCNTVQKCLQIGMKERQKEDACLRN